MDALGYLKFHGARTDELPRVVVLKNHHLYAVIEKLVEKLASQALHQKRGLEQRGAAMSSVRFAREVLKFFEKQELIQERKDRREVLIEVTDKGRQVFSDFSKTKNFPDEILDFLEQYT